MSERFYPKNIKINQFYMHHWIPAGRFFICLGIILSFLIPLLTINDPNSISLIDDPSFLIVMIIFIIPMCLISISVSKSYSHARKFIIIEDDKQYFTVTSRFLFIPILKKKIFLSSIKNLVSESYVQDHNESWDPILRYRLKAVLQNPKTNNPAYQISRNILKFDYDYDCNKVLKLLNFILESNIIYLSNIIDQPKFNDILNNVSKNRKKCKKLLLLTYAITISLILFDLLFFYIIVNL